MNMHSKEVLPADLRTGHWLNDIQHSIFVILFEHGIQAAQKATNRKLLESYVDSITAYLYIHFIDEEEGMAYSVDMEHHLPAAIEAHANAHLDLIDDWVENAFTPFKEGNIDFAGMTDVLQSYFRKFYAHIENFDQGTYGAKSDHAENLISENAHMSRAQLPMSPYMAGSYYIVERLAPQVARMLNQERLAPAAFEPMRPVNMKHDVRLLPNHHMGALRDRLLIWQKSDMKFPFPEAAGGHRPRSTAAA